MLEESINNLKTDWKHILLKFINENKGIESQYQNEIQLYNVFPEKENIFKAFDYFNFEELKVIIIGQDPYHQKGQAHGLCFSVQDNVKIPPSLKNIYKEINNNLNINYEFKNGNLTYLANQGILLLNNTLTVRESQPNSHIKIWNGFSKFIINYIVENSESKIFMLWGNNAKKIKKNININNQNKHYFLESAHPSPLSANKGNWFNNNHFTKCNEILIKNNKKIINWIN